MSLSSNLELFQVLDKKSLATSTVIANMEEFERKKRLNIRQNKLVSITFFIIIIGLIDILY